MRLRFIEVPTELTVSDCMFPDMVYVLQGKIQLKLQSNIN